MKKAWLLLAVVCTCFVTSAETSPVPQVATKVLGLFQDLRDAQSQKTIGRTRHVSFQLSSTEINEYMAWALQTTPRPGLNAVNVKVYSQNYISILTVVDFDAVEKWKPGTIPEILKPILSGKKNISVDYRFQAENRTVTFSVEKAYYASVRLPAFFVQEIIKIVAARQPEKYDTSKPLPLPFGLRRVWTADHVVMGET
jgi:hypothetical protein